MKRTNGKRWTAWRDSDRALPIRGLSDPRTDKVLIEADYAARKDSKAS